MITILPLTKARVNLGAVIEQVSTQGSQVILEKSGHPVAAIVDIDFLESMMDGIEIAELKKTSGKLHDWKDIKSEYGL